MATLNHTLSPFIQLIVAQPSIPKLLVMERGVYAASSQARHPDIGCRGVFPIQTPKRAEACLRRGESRHGRQARAPTNTNNLGMHRLRKG
jgi:hypothetical protein